MTAKSALSNEYFHKPLVCLIFQLFESFLNKYFDTIWINGEEQDIKKEANNENETLGELVIM